VSAPDTVHAAATDLRPPRRLLRGRRPRLPRYTIRLRLAVLYGGVFMVTGTLLLAIVFLSVRSSSHSFVVSAQGSAARLVEPHAHNLEVTPQQLSPPAPGQPGSAAIARARANQLGAIADSVNRSDLHQLLIWSVVALAIMVAASMALGWVLAGRVLRPLHVITAAARELSASSLHERLALDGPNDELRELGDTFDELLGRLEASFESQRQFVANASHELRTPLTLERAILEVTLADPAASTSSLRAACERVLAIGEQQERMIDALLTLAQSEQGLARREPLLLDAIAGQVLDERRKEIARRGLRLDAQLERAPATGDPRLIERLVANLLDNAIRHNSADGWITVTTAVGGVADGEAVFCVANSGPVVAAADVERLLRPFHRLGGDRLRHGDGHGLGLSIVAAIAAAHAATLEVTPQADGGLRAEVRFRGS
jgi:signal transduction histidine kinase